MATMCKSQGQIRIVGHHAIRNCQNVLSNVWSVISRGVMTDLRVRRVRFDFASADVPFNWQPERPAFAMQCNVISFFAPGFEKLIVDATREAIPSHRRPDGGRATCRRAWS
jgi:hypothetical protein